MFPPSFTDALRLTTDSPLGAPSASEQRPSGIE